MIATGVDRETVVDYLREQRLMVAGGGATTCIFCGARIAAGTICVDCRAKAGGQRTGALGAQRDSTGRMRMDHRK